ARQPLPGRQCNVSLNRHRHDQALQASVLGHKSEPRTQRVGRAPLADRDAGNPDRAGGVLVDANDRARHLAAPAPAQPRQPAPASPTISPAHTSNETSWNRLPVSPLTSRTGGPISAVSFG